MSLLAWHKSRTENRVPNHKKKPTKRQVQLLWTEGGGLLQDQPMTPFELPANWAEILDGVQRALTQASQLAQERENALAILPLSSADAKVRQEELSQLPGRLTMLDQQLECAGRDIAEVDLALADDEKRFRAHLNAAESLHARLAHWLARAIG